MADYSKQLQGIVKEYRHSGENWPASASEIAEWAIKTDRYDLATQTIKRICARDLAQAMREEYLTDKKGRRIRAKHPAKITRDGKQMILWDDIRTAPRSHMEMAFVNRRNHIVGECRQVKTDVDSYNDSHPNEQPIQMILDFTEDVDELGAVFGPGITEEDDVFVEELVAII